MLAAADICILVAELSGADLDDDIIEGPEEEEEEAQTVTDQLKAIDISTMVLERHGRRNHATIKDLIESKKQLRLERVSYLHQKTIRDHFG